MRMSCTAYIIIIMNGNGDGDGDGDGMGRPNQPAVLGTAYIQQVDMPCSMLKLTS